MCEAEEQNCNELDTMSYSLYLCLLLCGLCQKYLLFVKMVNFVINFPSFSRNSVHSFFVIGPKKCEFITLCKHCYDCQPSFVVVFLSREYYNLQ